MRVMIAGVPPNYLSKQDLRVVFRAHDEERSDGIVAFDVMYSRHIVSFLHICSSFHYVGRHSDSQYQ